MQSSVRHFTACVLSLQLCVSWVSPPQSLCPFTYTHYTGPALANRRPFSNFRPLPPSPSFPSLPFPSLPIHLPSKTSYRVWGRALSSPSGVRDAASAVVGFCCIVCSYESQPRLRSNLESPCNLTLNLNIKIVQISKFIYTELRSILHSCTRLLLQLNTVLVTIKWYIAVANITAQWIGPVYIYNVTFDDTGPYTDFYFICRIVYEASSSTDDGARFEVVLTFDSQLSSVTKTTTSASLDVIFTSQDIKDGFGTKVSLTFIPSLIRSWFIHILVKYSVRYCVYFLCFYLLVSRISLQ